MDNTNDWKLKLRYGKEKTAFSHFTVLAEGVAGDLDDGFSCPKGNAIMAMKTGANTSDESADMVCSIGEQIGFKVTGKIQIYETEPEQPPRENPHGYGINFTPFE